MASRTDAPAGGSGDVPPEDEGPTTIVGGVGYRFLRDFSVGPLLADRLAGESWPPGVAVEDLGYGPVAVVQRLLDARPRVERLVLVGSARRGRDPGTVTAYGWDGTLPDDQEVQARVAEAVTGVVDLDNLLVVVGALCDHPPEIVVVEIEPGVEAHGEALTPPVERGADRAARLVRALVDGAGPPVEGFPPGGPPLPEGTRPPSPGDRGRPA